VKKTRRTLEHREWLRLLETHPAFEPGEPWELPEAESRERAEHLAAADAQWNRAYFEGATPKRLAELRHRRRREVEAMLRIGPWGHALRDAIGGDLSRLALMLTRARVPHELRDIVYRVLLMHQPQPRGGRPSFNAVDLIGVASQYTLRRALGDEPHADVAGALADDYGVDVRTIERAVRERAVRERAVRQGALREPNATARRPSKVKARKRDP